MLNCFAIVKDDNNILMKGVQVQFSADGNSELEIVSGVTGNDGIAKAYLSSKTDYSIRDINVTATAGGNQISSKIKVNVVGTSIDVIAPSAVVLGGAQPNLPLHCWTQPAKVLRLHNCSFAPH